MALHTVLYTALFKLRSHVKNSRTCLQLPLLSLSFIHTIQTIKSNKITIMSSCCSNILRDVKPDVGYVTHIRYSSVIGISMT